MVYLDGGAHGRLADPLAALVVSPLVSDTAFVIVDCIIIEAGIHNSSSHTLKVSSHLKRLIPCTVFAFGSARHVESSVLSSGHEDVSMHLSVASAGSGAHGV